MSTGLEQTRERMTEYLISQGVRAVTAWPLGGRPAVEEPVAVVSLRGCQAGPSGLMDYLGERYNDRTGQWEELYGKRAVLTFGLDLYGPGGGDGAALQREFDRLAEALARGGPAGLAVQEFSCGETEYDPRARLCRRRAEVTCLAWLEAAVQPGEVFVDFELRGALKE